MFKIMGYKIEFNWVLKLKPKQGLDEKNLKQGATYEFFKEDYRVYPVGIPIDLINENWEVVGRVVISEFQNVKGKTLGKYEVIKIYDKKERELITKYWREGLDK